MKILAIETATKNCSVAIFEGPKLIAHRELNGGFSHAENLHVFIEETLKNAGVKANSLDAVAVSEGPGSYTGLRIGVSAAKGICYGIDKPLIAINTLQNMAWGMREKMKGQEVDYFIPMIDARRMEIYTAIFDQNLETILSVQPVIIDEENELMKKLSDQSAVFFGDGAEKCIPALSEKKNINFVAFEPAASSLHMGSLAMQKFQNNEIEDVAYFEPRYLKEFMATTPKKLL